MQTNFLPHLLADPDTALAEKILRKCVHCGFCTATCPTFLELGDELDSPRGRIWLIKEMLETGRPADAETVMHLDRCLSCLSCTTTCPSGVDYMHLVDHARAHVEKTFRRPLLDRVMRRGLSIVLTRPTLFRLALIGAATLRTGIRVTTAVGRATGLAGPAARMAGRLPARLTLPLGAVARRLTASLGLLPPRLARPSSVERPQVIAATGARRMRVSVLNGCAQPALDPGINEATIRLLTRLGVEVVVAKNVGCCGALDHHMGAEARSHAHAARNIEAWTAEMEAGGLDRIVINTSGCGTTVKDYGHMFRNDPELAAKAAKVAAIARDVTEVLAELDLAGAVVPGVRPKLAYHSACSMQHGQKITTLPMELLAKAGFDVVPVPESHVCCGSAGTYNILQAELATRLRDRKVANIATTGAEAIAAGNIGCIMQIASGTGTPILHTVELLDWATGGPRPEKLAGPGTSEIG
ncbi:MAG: heterodisulfide reductase-related iron-sulfur binding cluster [Siculibacillus sp.]|nr:heterodisulfide reductase-related iron-sulfur binding cluster [Siculibacillus sp.]